MIGREDRPAQIPAAAEEHVERNRLATRDPEQTEIHADSQPHLNDPDPHDRGEIDRGDRSPRSPGIATSRPLMTRVSIILSPVAIRMTAQTRPRDTPPGFSERSTTLRPRSRQLHTGSRRFPGAGTR